MGGSRTSESLLHQSTAGAHASCEMLPTAKLLSVRDVDDHMLRISGRTVRRF